MSTWSLTWRTAARRRRLFAWNVLVPLLLLTPVAASEAAAPHRVAVFGVFYVFFATFGAAIPTIRDAQDGWLDTIFRAGHAPRRWHAERVLAEASLDFVQLLPTTIVALALAGGVSPARAIDLAVALAAALVFANALGPAIAAAVGSLAEAALASAAVSLLLLHYAGFFRAPPPGWTRVAWALDPYAPLHAARSAALGARPPDGWGWGLWSALAGALALVVAAPSWTARFRWPQA